MKKVLLYLIAFLILFMNYDVYAEEYKKQTLIPIDTPATVNTDLFLYTDFSYSSYIDGDGNAYVSFAFIKNNSNSKLPVSINLLLFDENQKNIALVAYCSTTDYGGQYERFELASGQSSTYSIKITPKYFVADAYPKDVRYIAVLDDNNYCHIGGYTKYKGMTLEEIVGTRIENDDFVTKVFNQIMNLFGDSALVKKILYIACVLLVLYLYGSFINPLYYWMYEKNSVLVYLPFIDVFVITKLVFDNVFVSLGVTFVSIVLALLCYVNFKAFVYIFGVFILIPVLLGIIKKIANNKILFTIETKKKEEPSQLVSMYEENSVRPDEEALDLSYSNGSIVSNIKANDANLDKEYNVSQETTQSEMNNQSLDDNSSNNTNNNNDSGESSLSNFFR